MKNFALKKRKTCRNRKKNKSSGNDVTQNGVEAEGNNAATSRISVSLENKKNGGIKLCYFVFYCAFSPFSFLLFMKFMKIINT